ncbi:glycerol-3-phosphate dehydrogenase, partial [Thioclava sp. BHET1]
TALAHVLGRGGSEVILWARDAAQVAQMRESGENSRHLPGVTLPESVTVTADLAEIGSEDPVLLALPAQALGGFLAAYGGMLDHRALVACCKGIDMTRLIGPSALIAAACPEATPAVLTGPSFAADIARGLPTALTLACADDAIG